MLQYLHLAVLEYLHLAVLQYLHLAVWQQQSMIFIVEYILF